jgi:hypothetical protein
MTGRVQSRLHETFHTAALAMRKELAAVTMVDLLKSGAGTNDAVPTSEKIPRQLPIEGPPPSTYFSSEPRT